MPSSGLKDFLPRNNGRRWRDSLQANVGRAVPGDGIDRVVVATSDPEFAGHARAPGVMVFDEHEQFSHSVSADAACLRAIELGATTAMLVPIDVPRVTPSDFSQLAASRDAPGLIVVPSADGTGTNALVRTPPDVIESRFGPGSFRAHLEQARSKGVFTRSFAPSWTNVRY